MRTSKSPNHRIGTARSSWLAVGFLVLAAVLSCYPFVAPGHPSTVDAWPNLARHDVVYHAIKDGFPPFYSFMFYCGFPVLRFYSPLFYFLGGPLALLTDGNLVLALRILLVLLHLTSALAMYWYLARREVRAEAKSEGTGFGPALGAIVYLFVPWRTLYLTGIANYPQALVYLLLPLAFLAVEGILAEKDAGANEKTRQSLLLGLWVGLLFLAHLVYAIYALLFLAVFWIAKAKWTNGEWRALGTAALAGIGVSAFFLIPFVAEQAGHRFPITHLNLSVPDWMVLLGFKSRRGGYEGVYVGLSVILLSLGAVAAVTLRRRFRFQVPALLGLVGSLFLTFGPALLKEKQYLVTAGLPPERFLLFVVFFIALLVPSAYELVRSVLSRRRISAVVVFAVIAGVVMVDCLQSVSRACFMSRSEFLSVREEIYAIVSSEPHARLLDLNIPEPRIDDASRTLWYPAVGVIYGGLPTPLGLPYHQYAPRSMLHVYPWVDYITGDVGARGGQTISDNTYKALALMGASHLITLPALARNNALSDGKLYMVLKDGMDWDAEFVVAQREPPLALGRTHQNLVLAASRITPFAPDTLVPDQSFVVAANWRLLLDTLQLDEADNKLSFIPALAGTSPESLPGLPAVEIDSTSIRHQNVVVGFRVNVDCFLRVAVSYYPELEVLLDGTPVQFFETADHFTYLRCPAGRHVLQVKARLGGLRVATLLVSLLSLPVVLVLVIVRRRKPKPANSFA